MLYIKKFAAHTSAKIKMMSTRKARDDETEQLNNIHLKQFCYTSNINKNKRIKNGNFKIE